MVVVQLLLFEVEMSCKTIQHSDICQRHQMCTLILNTPQVVIAGNSLDN